MARDIRAEIAAAETEMEANREKVRPVLAANQKLNRKIERLNDELAESCDPTTDDGLADLARIGWSHGSGSQIASERLDTHFKAAVGPEVFGHKWRTFDDETLPVPSLALTRGQEVDHLTEPLLALIRRLHAGKEQYWIDLFEHTLSENGSYEIAVDPDGAATLVLYRYHRRTDLQTGPLKEILARAARDHWYRE